MNKDIHAIRENDDQTVSFYFGHDFVDAIGGVSDAVASPSPSFFDLSGRAVAVPVRRGVYISGGRKFVVK